MATLLEDIVTYLISRDAVLGDGVDAFRDFTPESPDNVLSVKEYPGDPAVPEDDLVNRSIQVSVRNIDATIAQAKAKGIFMLFKSDDLIVHFTSDRWGQVHLRQSPFRMGADASNRVTYGFNIGITTTVD